MLKKIREWIKENEQLSIFIGVLLILTSAFLFLHSVGYQHVDGVREAKDTRRKLECVFGGKVITYEGWWDEGGDGNHVWLNLDHDGKVKVDYVNAPCRKIRNKYLNGKKWGLK
jgi:hypothetical protein